jgi:hypothetical protein
MQNVRKALAIVLCIAVVVVPARAQQIVRPGAIDQALTEKAEDTAAKRQAIKAALQQPDVQRVAETLGVDVARADAAVATLGGADLDRIAAQAQLVNDEIAGGQTVRLNVLWVIIGLLILIIILVAD